jgi:hypothetical protein
MGYRHGKMIDKGVVLGLELDSLEVLTEIVCLEQVEGE